MSSKSNIIAWGFQIAMGALYVLASSGKVLSNPMVLQNFDNWGYPHGFYMIIGLVELICGILLFYPKTAGYASIVLFCVMIGAVLTHILHHEGLIVLKPIGHMIGLAIVFYLRFIQEMKNDDKQFFPLNQ